MPESHQPATSNTAIAEAKPKPRRRGNPVPIPEPVRFQPLSAAAEESAADVTKEYVGQQALGLYVHVPFCVTRCFFCDFVTVVGKHVTPEVISRYMAAVHTELDDYKRHPVFGTARYETGQLGGGTPTLLNAQQLEKLLDAVRGFLEPGAEIVVEGFPTSVSKDKLAVLRDGNDVKFNMGVQTFHDDVLEAIGRKHERDDAIRAIADAKESGLRSVGIDLIYGLPRGSLDTVTTDIEMALKYEVDHIALYPLWVYPQTRLNSLIYTGREEDGGFKERQEQLYLADQMLRENGFQRYTTFHYARGLEHCHEYGLWQMRDRDWLGAGQAAVSQLDRTVYENDRTIQGYIDRANASRETAATADHLDQRAHMVRHFSYGIREARYPFERFQERFGVPVRDVFGAQLDFVAEQKLGTVTDDYVELNLMGALRLGDIEKVITGTPAAA